MAAGAAAAVRGSRSSAEELYHIVTHSDRYVEIQSRGLFARQVLGSVKSKGEHDV